MSDDERSTYRAQLRHARKTLASGAHARASSAVARHAARTTLLTRRRHYGCFLSADGEVDTTALIARVLERGKTIWLPCLGQPTLRFRPYQPGMPMRTGDFGILEPAAGPFLTIRQLDAVFMPLVGFDEVGNRLGMGGGYYDRSLAFKRSSRAAMGPHLIGVALELQRVPSLRAHWWDIPLDAVITERGLQRFVKR